MTHLALRLAGVLLLGAGLLGPSGCGGSFASSEDPAGESGELAEDSSPRGVPVEVANIVRGDIARSLNLTGTLEAEQVAIVPTRVEGRVVKVLVEVGDEVVTDQVLARLEAADVELDLKEIRGERALAGGAVRQKKLALQEAQARQEQTEDEEARARQDKVRQESLAGRGLITEETLENAQAEHQKRLLDVQATTLAAERAQVEVEIEEARAANLGTKEARIELRQSRHMLQAPVSGTITAVEVKEHDAVSPGQALFKVMDLTSLELLLRVPEASISQLHPGSPARLATESASGAVFNGSVRRISPVVDPRSGTVVVEVVVQPSDGELRPGMFVSCAIETDRHTDVLLAPKRALVHDEGLPVLFIVNDDDHAVRVPLRGARRGLDNETHIEVDHTSLPEGTRVIVVGQANLKDGSRVSIVEEAP